MKSKYNSLCADSNRCLKNTAARGFTLVELLVVIVIIATLAGISFMGARKVLQSARESTAVSNLRTISQTLFTIQSDGGALGEFKLNGSYPAEAGYTKPGGKLYTWAYEAAEQMGYGHYDSDGWGGRFVWTTDPNETVFHDPTADWEIEDTGVPNARGNGTLWKTSHYAYNSQLGSFINPWSQNFQRGAGGYEGDRDALISQTTRPSTLIYVAQAAAADKLSELESSMPGHVVRSNSLHISPWIGGGSPATRIRGGANCAFADGHIGWVNTLKLYEGNWNSPNLVHDSTNPAKPVLK
ncbi:type II secretion system protein [Luteolibacter algae]|uniref:Type II secretion system protein n=1 Tax=Luteolibacter algae TaxID=454151 RepID=A0ABW5D8K7_9BACT